MAPSHLDNMGTSSEPIKQKYYSYNENNFGEDWEIIQKQKVVDKHIPPRFFSDGIVTYKIEFIIRNKKTGEVRRV